MKSLLMIIAFVSTVLAAPAEPNTVDRKIIYHTFNEEFDQAITLSRAQIKLNPDSPKYYYYYINARILDYYQRLAQISNDKRAEARKSLNKELIEYCEGVVDKFENSKLGIENKFYYGTVYAYLARVYGMDGSWWGAFKAGLKAKNIMEEIIASDPSFYDAYLVLGMLNYYADRLSGIASFAAGVLGFSGDRDKGLNYLQIAYNKGRLTYGQTALTLIEVYANLEDNETEAISYYENFLKRYPRNSRMTNAYVQELIGIWDLGKAEEVIKKDSLNIIEDYTKARFYDARGNQQAAIQYAEKALADEHKLWRGAGGNARFIIAKNAWLAGNSSLLKKFEPTLTDRNKENFDLLKNNEKTTRWLYQFTVIAVSKAAPDAVEKMIASKPALSKSNGIEAQFNGIAGEYYFRKNIFDKAEMYLSRNLFADDERDKYTAAKFLADIYMKKTAPINKVKTLLDSIDDMDSDRLAFRAKDLEKKYNL